MICNYFDIQQFVLPYLEGWDTEKRGPFPVVPTKVVLTGSVLIVSWNWDTGVGLCINYPPDSDPYLVYTTSRGFNKRVSPNIWLHLMCYTIKWSGLPATGHWSPESHNRLRALLGHVFS